MENIKHLGFILKIQATRMKMDYQDDSSFSSWYPIKPGHKFQGTRILVDKSASTTVRIQGVR